MRWSSHLFAPLLLAAAAACAHQASPPQSAESGPSEENADTADQDPGSDEAGGEAPLHAHHRAGKADPRNADAEQQAAAEPAPGAPAVAGLELRIIERGPGTPWILAVRNKGNEPVRVVADPRLLWFEVKVPGKRKPVTCRLPSKLFPDKAREDWHVELPPGQALAEQFDPRLLCFASGKQTQLVPGALITPHFGWPKKAPRTKWRKGKRVEMPAKQSAPFVAGPAEQNHDTSEADPADTEDPPGKTSTEATPSDESEAPERPTHLKELQGRPFALRSEYKIWAKAGLPDESERRDPGPLQLEMVQGSDAHAERTATVRISLKNASKETHRVYFRRELITFEIMGPDGLVSCDPQPDDRAPPRQSFLHLRPGQTRSYTSRLVELCPDGTFGQPGLYLVHGRFEADRSGERFNLNAFTGTIVSPEPTTVRVRTGDKPFFEKRPMRRLADRHQQGARPTSPQQVTPSSDADEPADASSQPAPKR